MQLLPTRYELSEDLMSACFLSVICQEDRCAFLQELDSKIELNESNLWSTITEKQNELIKLPLEDQLLVYHLSFLYLFIGSKNYTKLDYLGNLFGILSEYKFTLAEIYNEELILNTNLRAIDIFIEPKDDLIELVSRVVQIHLRDGFFRHFVVLKNLPYESYEHPKDTAALNALEKLPGLSTITKLFYENGLERISAIKTKGSYYRLSEQNNKRVFRIFNECCEVLDIRQKPALYIKEGPIGASIDGIENTVLLITTGTEAQLNNDELRFIIGHELGHLKSNHILYHNMAKILPFLVEHAIPIPILNDLLSASFRYTLLYWERMAELSCDRAGLLACQNINSAITVFAKGSGLPLSSYQEINIEDFVDQVSEFEGLNDSNVNKFYKSIMAFGETHPMWIERLKELLIWYNDLSYQTILNFDYEKAILKRRGDHGNTTQTEEIKSKINDKFNITKDFVNKKSEDLKNFFSNLK